MTFKKLLCVGLSCILHLGAVFATGVLSAVAENAAGLTVTDNGVYTMNSAYAQMPVTVEAEIKLTAEQGTRTGTLLGSWYYPSSNFIDVSVNKAGNPYVNWRKDGSSANETLTFTGVSVETGEWLHLAIVADFANSQVHCYVNGELKQTLTTAYTEAFPVTSAMSIGNNLRQGNGYNWRGEIRSIALYEDARTATEVAADVTAYGTDGLFARYDLQGKTEGDTLTDAVNGNNATWEQKWLDTKAAVGEYDYAIAVVGDPQTMSRNYPDSLNPIYSYIANTAAEKKLAYAFTLGDLTDTTTGVAAEWQSITAAMNLLNGVVPHTMVRGNHDNETFYDQYITVDAYGNDAVTKDGTMKNYYRDITIGGTDYLIVALDWRPDAEEQAWAVQVIENHPNHRVILTTHNFTNADGSITSAGVTGDGVDLFNNIVTKYPNIVLVLSGHVASENIAVGTVKGDNGNIVTHMLVDAQDADQPIQGGAGLVAYLYFSDNGKNVEVEWYSPLRDQYYKPANQFSFELDLPWDETAPKITVSEEGKVTENNYTFTPAGLSPYEGGVYTATDGKNYYVFPESETGIVEALNEKFHFYYDREGAVYKQRDVFKNNDTDGETRWVLMWNQFLQRTVTKAGGNQLFRKIDSLVPVNSLGQEITGKNFKTTFDARLEDENKGLVILGFRQQIPGKYTNGYYKLVNTHCFVAIGRKGITIAGGSDIVAQNGGTSETDMYNHLKVAFDDPETTETVEMLPKSVKVTVEATDNLCSVYIRNIDTDALLYSYEDVEVPLTSAGTFAYSVSDQKNSIGAISLEVYDDNGNVIDLATPAAGSDPSALRFYGGDVRVAADKTADGYLYTLTVDPVDGYRLDTENFYLTDADNHTLTPTRVSANTYTVLSATGGTLTAKFVEGTDAPMLQAGASQSVETFSFTPKGLSPYNGNYTVNGKGYYVFPETETGIVAALEEKFNFYYNREGALYTARNIFDNTDTADKYGGNSDTAKGYSRWILLYDAYLQRQTGKTGGEIMRKIDSLVPKNALGEEIKLKNFETTFNARFESADYGAILLGFRQQVPGQFVTGYYKMPQEQAFIAIGRKGITVAGGADIVAQSGGTSETDMYNHFETSFDNAETTDTVETLPQDITVKVRVVGTNVKVWIYPQGNAEAVYYEETTVPYTTAGTLAYGVSTVGHDIGAISLTKLDDNGKAVDIAVNETASPFELGYRGGKVVYSVEETENDGTFAYTLTATPNEGYELKAGSLTLTDENGNTVVPTRVGFRKTTAGAVQYTFESTVGGTINAEFIKPTVETPNIGNVGTSVNEEKAGVRFISRFTYTLVDGTPYVVLDGEKYAATDFGMLIGLEAVIGDNELTTALADSNAYIHRFSVKQAEIYYDMWDAGLDMSICITGVDKVAGGADLPITARAYVVADIGGVATTLYADAFTTTYTLNT